MVCVSEKPSPDPAVEIQFSAWALFNRCASADADAADQKNRFCNSRLTKNLEESRKNDAPANELCGEKTCPPLAVVGLASPIFAKVNSI